MERKTHKISEVMPAEAALFEGEFETDSGFSVHCTAASAIGDLYHTEFELLSESGHARYAMLGRGHYFADWGTYHFRHGLSYGARIDQPFVELHFQLDGIADVTNSPLGMDLCLLPGDTNLAVIPAIDGRFEMKQESRGEVFEVLLSKEYFMDLADRFPHLLERLVEKMHREEPSWLRDEHLRITPRMRGVMQRIRQADEAAVAGSLFLEAQILELLALQFAQLARPVSTDRCGLARGDRERVRAAAEWLLQRMDDPPTLAELARHALMNEFKLKRGFKELFGTSPYAYLLQHKLELARAYILDTDWSIAAIAHRVGYRDPAHLTNAFRKRFGTRPSDLRRSA